MGALGAGSFLPRTLGAQENGWVRISILHTTDLHGHILPTSSYAGEADLGGLARCATQIRRWKEANPNWLLLDAGDVFQGTDIGWRTRGQMMIRCFNALGYDGWAIGNHEFDWGMEPLADCIASSQMPALSANGLIGRHIGEIEPGESTGIRPSILKDVAGFKIGVIGLTTPGLPYWFHPSFLAGFEAGDPAEAAAREAKVLKSLGADAIIILAHMGKKPGADDFANRLDSVAAAVPDATLIIGAHTHQNIASDSIRGIPYTQAAYHGIHVGMTELYFDPDSRKLQQVVPSSLRMGAETPLDPAILSLASADLEISDTVLAQPAGRLNESLSAASLFGHPSDIERLIAAAIFEALEARNVSVDAVWHGSFTQEDLPAGEKTVADLWQVIPYENFVITGELTPEEMLAAFQDAYGKSRTPSRSLLGLRLKFSESGNPPTLIGIEDRHGRPLPRNQRFRIAMNTYDAASGGYRMLKLREVMNSAEARASIHPVQTREAVIEFLSKRGAKGVGKTDLPRT